MEEEDLGVEIMAALSQPDAVIKSSLLEARNLNSSLSLLLSPCNILPPRSEDGADDVTEKNGNKQHPHPQCG